MMLREGFGLATTGIAAGILVSLLSTRSLRALLFDVAPMDPLTLAGATALLL